MNPSTPDDPSAIPATPDPIPEIAPVPEHVIAGMTEVAAQASGDGSGDGRNDAQSGLSDERAHPDETPATAIGATHGSGAAHADASANTSAQAAQSAQAAGDATGSAASSPSAASPRPAGAGGTATELPAPHDGQDSTPDTVDGVARARLYGEPLFALPNDLYIPPDALEVFLEAFEGPLDLLLYLIRKQNFNVLDIPMAQVTKQYLLYVEQIRRTNLELASEYLLMAAMLIEIKSRMLLPIKKADTGEEAEDPRAELVRRLLEYEQMKLAAQKLDTLPVLGRDFLRSQVYIEQSLQPRFPDVDAEDLRAAWAEVLRRAKLVQHHKISREELSVREHMSQILRRLQGARFMEFTELFDVTRGVPVVVVNFIAMLELTRESLLEITQAEPFAPIYVRLTYTPN
ncbi:segregation and condensation protein A [Pandoraea anhela]|uniref:Segregation and condensation protein A n=1 Tax=Pandoraea anhela TaxID=2508295 RepID=A0A5E4YI28_9BURK|nr:segregation and condensation protein A [Pandoraea anhela]